MSKQISTAPSRVLTLAEEGAGSKVAAVGAPLTEKSSHEEAFDLMDYLSNSIRAGGLGKINMLKRKELVDILEEKFTAVAVEVALDEARGIARLKANLRFLARIVESMTCYLDGAEWKQYLGDGAVFSASKAAARTLAKISEEAFQIFEEAAITATGRMPSSEDYLSYESRY